MIRRLLQAAALAAVILVLQAFLPASAHAHDPGTTLVSVGSSGDADLEITAQIPLSRIDLAYHTRLDSDPAPAVRASANWLATVVRDRVRLTAADGATWPVTVDDVSADRQRGLNTARVRLTAALPTAATRARSAELRWDVVTDVVYSHKVLVTADGRTSLLTHQTPVVRLAVPTPPPASVPAASMLHAGFEHFRQGADHLLFLCVIALAAARRSLRRARLRARVTLMAGITAMFTAGHSVSLALASLDWVSLPTRVVDAGIALTIVVAAAHAVRPALSARTELALTAVFGLVHGLGFAGTLQRLALTGTDLILPLLGFNLGLEAAQLLALALIAVPIAVLARSPAVSVTLAASAAAVATGWVVERAFDLTNPVQPLTGMLLGTPERLAGALFAATAVLLIARATRPEDGPAAAQPARRDG
ncbi:HupE/UreJ family protein [Dactylosporangium sp. NPDC049742]|uniref:HupE/UreJ family protein n=1 Tax=Dactylosporangium sp. NPDC049742 TaxID=3154737 RepID=UPI00344840C3